MSFFLHKIDKVQPGGFTPQSGTRLKAPSVIVVKSLVTESTEHLSLQATKKFNSKSPEEEALKNQRNYDQIANFLKESDPISWLDGAPSPIKDIMLSPKQNNTHGTTNNNNKNNVRREPWVDDKDLSQLSNKSRENSECSSNDVSDDYDGDVREIASESSTASLSTTSGGNSEKHHHKVPHLQLNHSKSKSMSLSRGSSWIGTPRDLLLGTPRELTPEEEAAEKKKKEDLAVKRHEQIATLLKESDPMSWLEGPPKPKNTSPKDIHSHKDRYGVLYYGTVTPYNGLEDETINVRSSSNSTRKLIGGLSK